MTKNQKPVILLAFTNSEVAKLPMLQQELAAIEKLLRHPLLQKQIEIVTPKHTTNQNLNQKFAQYGNRMEVFHFSGHADGGGIHTEGAKKYAYTEGLAASFKNTPIKLVFLNGCATYGQVQALLDAGVPNVIATPPYNPQQPTLEKTIPPWRFANRIWRMFTFLQKTMLKLLNYFSWHIRPMLLH